MWRAMGWICDEKPNTVINWFKSLSVEKYGMVGLLSNKNDATRSEKPHKMEAQMVIAQSLECVG